MLGTTLRTEEYELNVAENGVEALSIADAALPDLILLDIMMPEMDGYETMLHLRDDAAFEQLPIIALTAKAMAGERERCLQAGANEYLSKPVDSEQLFAALGRWTLSRGASDGS